MATTANRHSHRIWAFVVAYGIVASVLALRIVQRQPEAFLQAPHTIPVWGWVFVVAACELCMYEIHYRTDSQTFSLADLGLALALGYASPKSYLLVQLFGLTLVYVLRRATRVRAAFNLVNTAATASVAYTIVSVLSPHAGPRTVRVWLVVLIAIGVSSPVGSVFISLVRSVAERRWLLADAPRLALFTQVNAIATGTIGILIGAVLRPLPWVAPLALVPTMLAYGAFKLYVRENGNRRNVEFLYEATNTLHRTADVDRALVDLLDRARTIFRAEYAQIAVARPDSQAWLRFCVGPDFSGSLPHALPAWIPDTENCRLITAASGQQELALLDQIGVAQAMVRLLRDDGRVLGLLVVADRATGGHSFTDNDRYLFDLLANQIAVGLENTHLERSLTELSRLEEELRHQANHDALTGLANRTLLSTSMRKPTRGKRAVLLIDLDDFKTINDSLGHAAGDEVLIEVAARLTQCVRPTDLVARLGGDEFAILLDASDTDAADRLDFATEMAERVSQALESPLRAAETDLIVRGSVGVAYVGEGANLSDALLNADMAMYEAKRAGKGTHCVFEPSMVDISRERLRIVTGLHLAFEEHQFRNHYQPIVDFESRECVAVETLLRWEHPDLGLLLPDKFVGVAEESGLIVEIGRWVLQRACEDLLDVTNVSGELLDVSVNVSIRQLMDPSFVLTVSDVLAESGFAPGRLILEITETTALAESGAVVAAAQAIQKLGVRLALDDFGTGYSSLGVVHRFPLDIVKIDKLFISTADMSLAGAIVAMTDSLKLTAVAEGVEDEHQIAELQRMGCLLGQGYAFSRPVHIGDLSSVATQRFGPGLTDPSLVLPEAGVAHSNVA